MSVVQEPQQLAQLFNKLRGAKRKEPPAPAQAQAQVQVRPQPPKRAKVGNLVQPQRATVVVKTDDEKKLQEIMDKKEQYTIDDFQAFKELIEKKEVSQNFIISPGHIINKMSEQLANEQDEKTTVNNFFSILKHIYIKNDTFITNTIIQQIQRFEKEIFEKFPRTKGFMSKLKIGSNEKRLKQLKNALRVEDIGTITSIKLIKNELDTIGDGDTLTVNPMNYRVIMKYTIAEAGEPGSNEMEDDALVTPGKSRVLLLSTVFTQFGEKLNEIAKQELFTVFNAWFGKLLRYHGPVSALVRTALINKKAVGLKEGKFRNILETIANENFDERYHIKTNNPFFFWNFKEKKLKTNTIYRYVPEINTVKTIETYFESDEKKDVGVDPDPKEKQWFDARLKHIRNSKIPVPKLCADKTYGHLDLCNRTKEDTQRILDVRLRKLFWNSLYSNILVLEKLATQSVEYFLKMIIVKSLVSESG